MKKLLLLSAFIGCTTAAVAQNCKSVDDKKDSFTGKTVRHARLVIGNVRTTRWMVELDQVDGQTSMKWNAVMRGEFNAAFPDGTIMLFKLEDGTVLKLGITEQTTPVSQFASGYVSTQYELKFNLTKEELTHFAQSPIEAMKVDVPGMSINNPPIKDSQKEPITRACQCLLATAS